MDADDADGMAAPVSTLKSSILRRGILEKRIGNVLTRRWAGRFYAARVSAAAATASAGGGDAGLGVAAASP